MPYRPPYKSIDGFHPRALKEIHSMTPALLNFVHLHSMVSKNYHIQKNPIKHNY